MQDAYDRFPEKSACGVGFVVNRQARATREIVLQTLHALRCVEHRGACAADRLTGDGAGIMTDIPFELLGQEKGKVAVATLFAPRHAEQRRIALDVFRDTFGFFDMEVTGIRKVPVNEKVLGQKALELMPEILHAFVRRPEHCRTDYSFDKLLYLAKQINRSKLRERGITDQFFFTSLSTNTIVYKGLTTAHTLADFYLDLKDERVKSRFGMFHRRFSTNTVSTWDKAQPFRFLGHNGEINTIACNRSWAFSREKALGLREDELITHRGISDSGTLNEMAEALAYRSSIPNLEDILAILMPPAHQGNPYYTFWSRCMEPWDGPAFIVYSDGQKIGARLDRNGFRPCRWALTPDHFYLSSEAGVFDLDESEILEKGTLHAGTGVNVSIPSGKISFIDPSQSPDHQGATFDVRLHDLYYTPTNQTEASCLSQQYLFGYTEEDTGRILDTMISEGKEPISSMGDTARPAILSEEPRPFFDYFYQHFAQVTNPPVDYLRERHVTELSTYLGKRLNIFSKKDLLPPPVGLALPSPVLGLGQMEKIRELQNWQAENQPAKGLGSQIPLLRAELDMVFDRSHGVAGFRQVLNELSVQAVQAVQGGATVLIISDRKASYELLPIPSLLAMRAIIQTLHEAGLRLDVSIVVDSAEVRSTHHLAALIGFGANAVCPYLALEMARFGEKPAKAPAHPEDRERNLIKAFEQGLLKVMSKMGISVVRSYQNSKLFTSVGLSEELIEAYFPGVRTVIGGLTLDDVAMQVMADCEKSRFYAGQEKPMHSYVLREHNKGLTGEKHSMTAARSKIIHQLVREKDLSLQDMRLYDEYLRSGRQQAPVNIRHLLRLRTAVSELAVEDVHPVEHILRTFGAGAMSFGAISAEAQRDIFLAMKAVGGRSNSGEGGENPYYYSEGISATVKQVASARFGVTARYLIHAEEIEIKVAQGAKPGEGGQLMGTKVSEDIAFARNAGMGTDLISPPPLHDIYSIEDLKQLIYELKQVHPKAKIIVKLVSGHLIGTVALGVAKAGADIIQISGGDGGTGAAPISSMRHAGLPWEFGLTEVHQALVQHGLRAHIVLRVDGGLSTGEDIVMAAMMGAEEFNFGKLLLVAQGCVMARICEKNTCPTGIATHDPRYKAKYKGNAEHIISLLQYIAEDVRRHLAKLGLRSLQEAIGRNDLLEIHPDHAQLVRSKRLDLSFVLGQYVTAQHASLPSPFGEGIGPLNAKIAADTHKALIHNQPLSLSYHIRSTDRAVGARLAGDIAWLEHQVHIQKWQKEEVELIPYSEEIRLHFRGSAGQGFGAFMTKGMQMILEGEANDGVGKSMSGGILAVRPVREVRFDPAQNIVIGNCALYGATGGRLYVYGKAADRFAVRNSGAIAVAEGAGLHACEYMTRGQVILLGNASANIGGGMTGGKLFLLREESIQYINTEYLSSSPVTEAEYEELYRELEHYHQYTQSHTAKFLLSDWPAQRNRFHKFVPRAVAAALQAEAATPQATR